MIRRVAQTEHRAHRPSPLELAVSLEANPVVATGLADEIAFRIERAIIEGAYPPGSRLPQDELCARFGVSRTPIREALRKLQARNLVVVVPNRGATVRIPTRKELMDVYDVRGELEGYAAELAAKQLSDWVVARLDAAQKLLEDAVRGLSPDSPAEDDQDTMLALHLRLNQANDEFHGVVMEAAGNERLSQLTQDLGRMFPKDYIWRAMQGSQEMEDLNLTEHRRIRDALATADPDRARAEMRHHIRHARTVLLRYLDQLGFWS
jgi:DNA-binding GntR family transcriptional regulator